MNSKQILASIAAFCLLFAEQIAKGKSLEDIKKRSGIAPSIKAGPAENRGSTPISRPPIAR